MQYDKQVIDVNVIAYHLNPNNIYDAIEMDLNIINRFLAPHIHIQSNAESLEIRKQFHNFKLRVNGQPSATNTTRLNRGGGCSA